MSKALNDSLFLLIKSLQRSEKRHFRLYVKRNSASANPLFLVLYNFLDRHARYCEEDIFKGIPELKKSQLANIKSKLYKELLTSLRLLRRDSEMGQALREQVDFANILYSKRLYRQSLQLLDKAKKKALELEMRPLALEIISLEKLIESQYITRSIETRAQELAASSESIIDQLARENRFSTLSLQLYGLYLKIGFARNVEDVNRIVMFYNAHVPAYQESELRFYEKLYLFQSKVWMCHMTHDFPGHYRNAQKWVDLFAQFPHLIASNIPLYLKGLHNLLYSLFRGRKYEQFVAVLDRLEHLNENYSLVFDFNEAALHQLFLNIHKINKHYFEGSFTDALNWVPELELMLDANEHNWDLHRIMVFYYRIACVYFGSGDNKKAIDYLNKIINNPDLGIRHDIQSFARILNLIAHFELGNEALVTHQLKSVYRFLAKQEELNEVHREIFSFLRHTPSMDRYGVRKQFENLMNRLKKVNENPFERRSFLYLDIISWLESKVRVIPVEEVMKENFQRLIDS